MKIYHKQREQLAHDISLGMRDRDTTCLNFGILKKPE